MKQLFDIYNMKKILTILLCASFILPGCGNMSRAGKGALIGAGSGAAAGAGLGAIIGKDGKSAAIGGALGTAVGAAVGAVIGDVMDKKAAEMAEIEGVQVETITDINGLDAIKVTFDSGILFETGKYALTEVSKVSLSKFAVEMRDLPETDITIYGHTDNTGSAAVNERLSLQRAQAVADYLKSLGIAGERMIYEGKSYTEPLADNSTVEGRRLNRRVEVFISANETMIKQAEEGTL
jgi:outer membrane protein OmpA-like peptidoglycan-associated protein